MGGGEDFDVSGCVKVWVEVGARDGHEKGKVLKVSCSICI